jgi:hypothetical protein
MGTTPGRAEPRFPGFDVLGQTSVWDEVTSAVVLRRLGPHGPLSFFGPEEEAVARALLDRLLAQDDEPRVPVLELIDQRLAEGSTDGYRYSEMPEDGDAWHRSLAGLEEDARKRWDCGFAGLSRDAQGALIEDVRQQEESWHGMPANRVFSLWTRYACDAFYSHPWAWNEIGFGGPAYPRGYKNIGIDRREPWERPEHDAADPIPWIERAENARQAHKAMIEGEGAGEGTS